MLAKLCLCLMLVSFVVATIVKERIAQYPPKLFRFDHEAWMGRWYCQARMPPCNWERSNEFTDRIVDLYTDGKTIISESNWRNDMCVTTKGRYTPQGPGCFRGKDNIGDVWSGDIIIPTIDYDQYFFYWGCVKQDINQKNRCADPWISVYTRALHPTPNVLKRIEADLHRLFNLSLTDLDPMSHNSPCKGPPKYQEQPRGRKYLWY